MMQRSGLWLAVAATAVLAACGEKPQTASAGKNDVAPYQGAQNSFVAAGWKAGDKTSWEQGLKARGQNTQNEYNKTK
jgi:major membrane immunogen (membrane-anchored lipoprotein)